MADENLDPLAIQEPPDGRIHRHRRRVQPGDTSPRGRLRLDALATYLQDISDEDTTDAGFPPDEAWVVRRADVGVTTFPTFRDTVEVSTWGSGIGGRWAERRVRIVSCRGPEHGLVDAAVLWVHLDERGRPARLSDHFLTTYETAVRGRTVRARLSNPEPPAHVERRAFPLRATDFDLMGHVNNAVSWVPVEGALLDTVVRAPLRVRMEHPLPIDIGADPQVCSTELPPGVDDRAPGIGIWIEVDGAVRSAAHLRFPA